MSWVSYDFSADTQAATIDVGDLVALYRDLGVASDFSSLVLNEDLTVNTSLSPASMNDDVFLGITTPVQGGGGSNQIISLNQFFPDNALIYTVIFDSSSITTSSLGLISDDSPFDTTGVDNDLPAANYFADGGDATLGTVMGTVTVVPEPTTFMLMLVAGLGLFTTRRFKK